MSASDSREIRHASAATIDAEPLEAYLPKRRIVVAIGIDAYQKLPQLHRAVSDAMGVQRILVEQFGFEAPLPPLLDGAATRDAIESLLEDQLRTLLQPDDALVLFYAGHGVSRIDRIGDTVSESGYIAPVDAEDGKYATLLDLDPLLRKVGQLPPRHILVVLDSCNSGMALGASVAQFRSQATFVADLATKLSRRVITSARRDQPALDGGPIEDHSLFTGTLIDGLRWGKAAYGSNCVTSSSLGLFLQQQVGAASESRQTPDFGSFHLDDRGEMVLPLGEGSFDNVRASAFAALQQGQRARFRELVAKAAALRPSAPETIYLRLRQSLIDGAFAEAKELARELMFLSFDKGRIPLGDRDLQNLGIRLNYWRELLLVKPGGFPLTVEIVTEAEATSPPVSAPGSFAPVELEDFGDLRGHRLSPGQTFTLRVTNPAAEPAHLYMLSWDPAGRIEIVRLWEDFDSLANGLAPRTTASSLPIQVLDHDGIVELWCYYSPRRIDSLVSPPSPGSRAAMPAFPEREAALLRLHKIFYLCKPT